MASVRGRAEGRSIKRGGGRDAIGAVPSPTQQRRTRRVAAAEPVRLPTVGCRTKVAATGLACSESEGRHTDSALFPLCQYGLPVLQYRAPIGA